MAHTLVEQLRFTRSELLRCLDGVSAADAQVHHGQMNCMSWIVGHLANHENQNFVFLAQGVILHPALRKRVGYGAPRSTPDLREMWAAWHEITAAADVFLDDLTTEGLLGHFQWKGEPLNETIGTMLHRTIYHYWFHIGEAHAIRQMLGHQDLPQFVGDMRSAPFKPA